MNRRLLGVAGAAALAVIGTFAILAYVRDADDRAQADAELVEVYTVDERVAAGSDAADLRRAIDVEMVQAGTVVDGVVVDLAELDGKVAAVDLVPGEQLLRARLVDAASFDDGRNRLTSIPVGKHEVTVSLAPERALGGQVVPGDTVSVIASFVPFEVGTVPLDPETGELLVPVDDLNQPVAADPAIPDIDIPGLGQSLQTPNVTHILLHKVLVTRVQVEQLPKEVTDADGNTVDSGVLAPTGNLLVTVALDAPEIERLVFTAEFGLIWLSYEPAEASEDGTRIQTRGSVYIDEWPEPDPDPEVEPVSEDVAS